MNLEESIRRYVKGSLVGAITKVTRLGRELKKDGVVVGLGCGVFPLSLVKITQDRGDFYFSDILNDDAKRKGRGEAPLGFGMYDPKELPKFERDSEVVHGTVGILYVIPVEFFDDPEEANSPTIQRYRIGYYGVDNGELLGGEMHLSFKCLPITEDNKDLEISIYKEYLEQYRDTYFDPAAPAEVVAKKFREEFWPTMRPRFREVATSYPWVDNDLQESPYRMKKAK